MSRDSQAVFQSLAKSCPKGTSRDFWRFFSRSLLEKAGVGFLSLFDSKALAAFVCWVLQLVSSRPRGQMKVRVFNPTRREQGWGIDATAIEVLLRDRPFIVDSIRNCLEAQGLDVIAFIHPVLALPRDSKGTLLQDMNSESEASREAYQLFLVRRVERSRHAVIRERLNAVLNDVVLATDDFEAMKEKTLELRNYLSGLAAGAGAQGAIREGHAELGEAASFLEWLLADNFVFLGYREYDIFDRGGKRCIQTKSDSGLGILRKMERSTYASCTPLQEVPEKLRERMTGGPILLITKTNADSTVHRPVRMDYIGVKVYDQEGKPAGEKRILGLFTSKAHSTSVRLIPLIRRKLRQVLDLDHSPEGSHDFKQVVAIFNSMPRDELFWSSPEQLHREIRTIMEIERQRRVRLTVRSDPLGRGLALTVIMLRDRFNTSVRQEIQRFLSNELEASHVDYSLAMGEDETHVRLHFFFATERSAQSLKLSELDAQIAEFTRSWEEKLLEEMLKQCERARAWQLVEGYARALEEGYRAGSSISQAVRDIQNLEILGNDPYLVDFVEQARGTDKVVATEVRIYHQQSTLVLSDVVPILESLGLRVIEQISYSLDGRKVLPAGSRNPSLGIDIFRVLDRQSRPIRIGEVGTVLGDALLGLLLGRAEVDRLNQLVLTAGLTIRQVRALRAIRAYLSQVQAAASFSFVADTLLKHYDCAAAICAFFEAKFKTPFSGSRAGSVRKTKAHFYDLLSRVTSLAEDEVLRIFFQIVEATLRTNFFLDRPYISLKFDSRRVPVMPDPRPLFEIFVFGQELQGIHLRGGLVARGGIRWSDRPDDFRTEVLGLMKTQMTKNAVIVPVGSKGGFVVENPPQDRDALQAYVQQQYETFIRGLLDLTDNVIDGAVVHPSGLVVEDQPDPYLVVAADKGTATFSDLANKISQEYEFWLGDAFASGGSHGYDHKKEGITARGVWECVNRHFRELGMSVDQDTLTVAGIGDMSGDVFGNGMLYSKNIRLLAAFNHQHIFLDPDPDPTASFRERKRLFDLTRSTWDDYDPACISAGGGVFSRHAKEIKLSRAAAGMLGLKDSALSGRGLIRAILQMNVDLLFNGGIGTYVKASSERHSDVGDPPNDSVRVDASGVRAKVVAEGGNLGFTQLARIEYALRGGRIDTDAIHNSGGVDLSDHEVNIKILLQPAMVSGSLSADDRNALLKKMTDEVVKLVLKDNDSQSLCLSLAEEKSREELALFESLQEHLVDRGGLDAVVERLPDSRVYRERGSQGLGLTRPELAVLLAYAKMALTEHLLVSNLPDHDFVQHYLSEYFPQALSEDWPDLISDHRLRREIIACQLTNLVIDKVGIAFIHGTIRDTGATPPEVVRAAVAALGILDLSDFLSRILSLDARLTTAAQYRALREVDQAVRGVVQSLLLGEVDLSQLNLLVDRFGPGIQALRDGMSKYLPASERALYRKRAEGYQEEGFPARLARKVASLDYLPTSLGIILVRERTGVSLEKAAKAFYAIGEKLHLGTQRDALASLKKGNKWEKIAVAGVIMDLRNVQQELTVKYLVACAGRRLTVDRFLKASERIYQRFERAFWDLESDASAALTKAAVLSRILDRLARSGDAGRETD